MMKPNFNSVSPLLNQFLRFNELIEEITQLYPGDQWVMAINQDIPNVADGYSKFAELYNRIFALLDENSFKILKEKALKNFTGPSEGNNGNRGKQQFFNHLDEALAYEYLANKGYTNIQFVVATNNQKTPDLSFQINEETLYCEVKTVNRSDEDIIRYREIQVQNSSIYENLSEGFFNKLSSDLSDAKNKVPIPRLVYMIVLFDGFTLAYWDTYSLEIENFLKENFHDIEVFIRVGYFSEKRLHHNSSDSALG